MSDELPELDPPDRLDPPVDPELERPVERLVPTDGVDLPESPPRLTCGVDGRDDEPPLRDPELRPVETRGESLFRDLGAVYPRFVEVDVPRRTWESPRFVPR